MEIKEARDILLDTDLYCVGYAKREVDEAADMAVEALDLLKAKEEGRVIALPCKVGDEIFSFKWSIKNEKYEVHTGKVKNVRYDSSDGLVTVSDGERYCVFGKTVFLTREAAEKALGGGEDVHTL